MKITESELARQQANAKAVRAAIFNAKPKAAVVAQIKVERQEDALRRQIKILELDLSDARARIISQSEIISLLLSTIRGEELQEIEKKRKPVKEIVTEVLRDFPGVTWEDIKGIRRERRLVRPRQICMFEIYEQRRDLSFPAIGRLFGGRDHTTVLHAVKKVRAERVRTDRENSLKSEPGAVQ